MARFEYRPYTRVADRLMTGARIVQRQLGDVPAQPVARIEGRAIANTFWGEAWCKNLESYSDYENRLPRGRTYVRNGSVMHLAVAEGKVTALVQGSMLYEVEVTIAKLAKPRWSKIVAAGAGRIDSLVELLQGRLSTHVMKIVTDHETGMFPSPAEIELSCSCPDWAEMCKHVAAALYGIGTRLDEKPELLFLLRGVDQTELLGTSGGPVKKSDKRTIAEADLESIFGVELTLSKPTARKAKTRRR